MSGRVVIPGGSGHCGEILARALWETGRDVVVLSRDPRATPWRTVRWDGISHGAWATELEGADAVIGLSGRSVNCRYGAAHRAEILESRIRPTRLLGEAIGACHRPPRVWLQASTATIYAHRFDAPNDETGGILGGDEPGAPDTWQFSIDVAKRWEAEIDAAATPATRRVKMRSAIVMSPEAGGAFELLLRLVRLGLGGRAGNGRQYVSWIHGADFARAVLWLLEQPRLEGAVNLAAPAPLPNAEFMSELRAAWGCAVGLPAPRPLLEVGAFVIRTETELLLKSRRVVPRRLLEDGFDFRFPDWTAAAADLCVRWRRGRQAAHAA